ncbi:diguanylate cyclase [Niallia circulans]|uniref:Diguanylate cyclase n=1 Tax=Niallia circulans TaxID=1397 RepID=A0A0J1IJ89_NIACI|nr:HD-GYP domain-containing protein [Niallia circulans]KLV26009.1 diguanylate cyclase [Niallia circulans]
MHHRIWNNPAYFRYLFFILFIISIILNRYILQNHDNYFILYILCSIFLGLGFYNSSLWKIVMLTFLVVVCRFFFIPEPHASSILTFITYLLTYLLITFITVAFMSRVQRVMEDNLALTKVLSNALDSRDSYTMHHSKNVAKYAMQIAEKMKLPHHLCEVIHIGGLLHDIGKIGIPESLLTKPGKLTATEYELIKKHTTKGYEIIKHVKQYKNSGILDIVLYHHERFDGKGYPQHLKGEEIPLLARIVAVADTFDAMSSGRVYRKEIPLEEILHEIRLNKGKQFDPNVVDAFLALFEEKNKPFTADS